MLSEVKHIISPSCAAAPYEFCDVGWVGKGDSCYWVLEDARTWFGGHEMCRDQGGELASVKSRVENDYVFSLLASLVTRGKKKPTQSFFFVDAHYKSETDYFPLIVGSL